MTILATFHASNAGDALNIIRAARNYGLSASYHPHGGQTEKKYTPVSHTVYVAGTPKDIYALRLIIDQKEGHHAVHS